MRDSVAWKTLRPCNPCVVAAAFAVALASCASAQEDFEGWNLEPGISQAHLVMVARVTTVGSLTVVEGAKTDVALREYRFQPVQILKGIFQRDILSMTPSDLGCPAEVATSAPLLEEGEFRLLILAQQRGQIFGCVAAAPGATTFEQRVPRLSGLDDPLVNVVRTLIKVADSRSRRERATLLLDRLSEVEGVAAIPLLTSLRLRAEWAAADARAYGSPNEGAGPGTLATLALSPLPAQRAAALDVLREMLATGIRPQNPQQLNGVAEALRNVLKSGEAVTHVRLAAIEALGHLLAMKSDVEGAPEVLIAQLSSAPTHAERAAVITALARVANPQTTAAVLDALARLPLDELPASESTYFRAAVRLDASAAEQALLTRLERSIAARQSLEAEVDALGRLRSKQSLPLLLAFSTRVSVTSTDLYRIASAFGQLGDDRAVPILVAWLRSDDGGLKENALQALESIDSEVAAREARPLLKTEGHLPYKLRLARLLARHGIADGYALATEHLADAEFTSAATLVLAALSDPRTSKELSAIVAAPPDRHWHAAALTGLVAIGDANARKQLLEILADDRHPMAAEAAQAVGLSTDSELLLPLAALAKSRNKQIALASLTSIRRFSRGVATSPRGLAGAKTSRGQIDDSEESPPAEIPAETRAALSESLRSLALDAYVEPDVRDEALAAARALGDEGYGELLMNLADQTELEGTPLLVRVQAERRRLQREFRR